MKNYFYKLLAVTSISGAIIATTISLGAWTTPKTTSVSVKTYKQMYTLGDSLSDNGVLAHLLHTILPWNRGIDDEQITMGGAFYHHSFSNGPVTAEKLAHKLGLKLDYGYRYLGYNNQLQDRFGYNYALAGGRAGTLNEDDFLSHMLNLDTYRGGLLKHIINPGLNSLKDWFNEINFNGQVNALLAQHQALNSTDLVLVEIGGNDIFVATEQKDPENQQAVINDAVNKEIAGIEKLLAHNHQATIIVGNLPDVSLVPAQANQKGLTKQLTQEYNSKLLAKLAPYIKTQQVKYANFFTEFHDLYEDFKTEVPNANVTDPAVTKKMALEWSRNVFEYDADYNFGVSNTTINNYFFFDQIHPNSWATTRMADFIYDQL